jgi:diguanylate cyclase (GGDEF)-like protein
MTYAIHVNLYAIALIIMIMVSLRKHKDLKSMNNAYYKLLVILVGTTMVVDMFAVVLDGGSGAFIYYTVKFLNVLLYGFGGLVAYCWVLYIDHHMLKTAAKLHKHKIILSLPLLVNSILSILTFFFPIFFLVDSNNSYVRGDYFLVSFILTYIYLIYSVFLIVKDKNKIPKRDIIPLLMFPILPFLGSLLQIMFYGTLLIWPLSALSLLIIFIFVQSQMINIDGLTELYNQREYQDYVLSMIKKKEPNHLLAGVMLDIDDFKLINDDFGHATGDEILKQLAHILRDSFRRDDFIARIGGDEFVVFMKVSDRLDFERVLERLNANLLKLNIPNHPEKSIFVSVGFDIYQSDTFQSFDDFIQHLDRQMYLNKRS